MATEYTDGRVETGELPTAAELLRAFREPRRAGRRRHSVLDAAHELVQCHERRRRAQQAAHVPGASSTRVAVCSQLVDDIDLDRARLIERINSWVAENIVHRTGASLHTETLGAVIDRMAAKWTAAHYAVGLPVPPVKVDARIRAMLPPRWAANTEPPRSMDGEAHLHWMRLAELADGYKDLITDVAEHRRRLPVF
jgi:hypothetical protein